MGFKYNKYNNTINKEYRISINLSRDTAHLKKFITTYVPPGNNIIIEGWS